MFQLHNVVHNAGLRSHVESKGLLDSLMLSGDTSQLTEKMEETEAEVQKRNQARERRLRATQEEEDFLQGERTEEEPAKKVKKEASLTDGFKIGDEDEDEDDEGAMKSLFMDEDTEESAEEEEEEETAKPTKTHTESKEEVEVKTPPLLPLVLPTRTNARRRRALARRCCLHLQSSSPSQWRRHSLTRGRRQRPTSVWPPSKHSRASMRRRRSRSRWTRSLFATLFAL